MFKQRKNKTFQYQSRFSKENQEQSEEKETSETEGFVSKWRTYRDINKRKRKGGFPIKMLLFILVLLLICMYLLENRFN
ncbi:hypothetical protein APS56_14440 [Pseudalgibacter alginicilyticus]|uniref:Riboflavin synthase subunit beta n=1 Tax=Pseudalgibacter alginicilyticus TaxID=1736674 RepID=A0A0P0CTR0_9FLAO|nr:hypothetical protein [Pseudalgibacter alginicilyticus]ALJ06260.1 hypothetical protein APS56_14440 [Pseudalgibacter alginicilyticus]